MRAIPAVLFLILPVSCTISPDRTEAEKIPISGERQLDIITLARLQETPEPIGQVVSFDMIDEDQFVIATESPSRIYKYDMQGRQLQAIGATGRGPFEYVSPSVVRVSKEKEVYLWCNVQLKLIVFDTEGNPLTEYKDFIHAVGDFAIFGKQVFFYNKGVSDGPFVDIYCLETRQFVAHLGMMTVEQSMLDRTSCSGGIAVWNDSLVFVPSDQLCVLQADVEKYSVSDVRIHDPVFEVEDLKGISGQGVLEMRDYLFANARVLGVYPLDDLLVIQAETGRIDIALNSLDLSERLNRFYFLDSDRKVTVGIMAVDELNIGHNCLFASRANRLFSIRATEDGSFSYVIGEVLFAMDD
jgi:hypothetical protein